MTDRSDRRSSLSSNLDEPPNSRLFIIGSKLLCEDDFRKAFEEFGNIEEIWMVRDRQTGESKGVTYIKYSKTSEAARALEAMNGKCIGKLNRSIRVMIAASRDQGSKRDSNEEERTLRLFVVVPKSMTDSELYDTFKEFGEIDYATIMRDKESRESKGFAYVKYFKFSHAAAAFETCDKKYKAVFAEPRKPNMKTDEKFSNSWSSLNKINSSALPLPTVSNPVGYTKLIAIVSPQVNQDQLWKLFDIVPGLDYCHLRLEGRPKPNKGVASVVYNSAQWAAYAKEKLHGFEYPPGNRIIVKPDHEEGSRSTSSERQKHSDIFQIAETIAQASNLIQAAGLSPDVLQARLGLIPAKDSGINCSVKLPEPQPLAPNEETVSRCFIVCTPNPPPPSVLKDVFSRFGNLIDVYMLNNRNCGFAKYASTESAENAIKTLHGAEVCGIRIKVLKAEEKQEHNRKRQRVEEKP
ncbi:RNA-binding protein 45 isoform X1 [Tribolium castaneum]|uniref:RNA-binding protein 45-like Protein n=2 Tax=Tribolium castaneum TaxID=7070 RepID=D6WN04_TRICA|nr:PREDICTED: RNA-binding protein 45 isoform X1 [Tribolium castaneum]EFA04331.1 RNA-binding protein 45-like Protein [Tribolium castaneum]|eukprot:XP_970185.1 PREDICTED: RNA-binding protein 45 isoform X1 [Tribolium castaneum]